MKRIALALCLVGVAGFCFGQTPPPATRKAVRIPIYHADPWAVKALLEGKAISMPEISTVLGMAGMGGAGQSAQQASQAANTMFGDGFLIVNPTDNSLWFFPNKH